MIKRMLIGLMAAAALVSCQESMEERAARDAHEITTKKCPMPIGNEGTVILERVEFDIPTQTWKEDLLLDFVGDKSQIDLSEIKSVLISELKNTPSYKPYRDHGFKFHYVYCRMSAPKDTLINITLSKADY